MPGVQNTLLLSGGRKEGAEGGAQGGKQAPATTRHRAALGSLGTATPPHLLAGQGCREPAARVLLRRRESERQAQWLRPSPAAWFSSPVLLSFKTFQERSCGPPSHHLPRPPVELLPRDPGAVSPRDCPGTSAGTATALQLGVPGEEPGWREVSEAASPAQARMPAPGLRTPRLRAARGHQGAGWERSSVDCERLTASVLGEPPFTPMSARRTSVVCGFFNNRFWVSFSFAKIDFPAVFVSASARPCPAALPSLVP